MTERLTPYRAGPPDVALLLPEFRAALPLVMTIVNLVPWLERFERAGVEVTLYSRPGRDGLELRYREAGTQGRV